jgi:hypothetical protein
VQNDRSLHRKYRDISPRWRVGDPPSGLEMEARHVRFVGAPTVGQYYDPDAMRPASYDWIGRPQREVNDIQGPSIAIVAHVD